MVEEDIPTDMVGEREYIVEIHKDSTNHIIKLYDTLTGKVVECTYNGWEAGRQNQHYYFYCEEGTFPIIKKFQVFSLNRPDVVFDGDSITEGVGVTDKNNRYAELFRINNPDKKVVISARGSGDINLTLSKFESEYNIYRPKILCVLIGANGGNTLERFKLLKENCDKIGCKLIVNRLTCQQSTDKHIAGNELIESLGLPGARFDVATAKDNYPFVDNAHSAPRYNEELYYDQGLHPKDNGQKEMYNRLYIDVPEIFI